MFQALGQQGSMAPALPRNNRVLSTISTAGPVMIKRKAVEEAETQQKVIEEKLRKLDLPPTGYEFKELIGKGAYGRVYKSLHKRSGDIVAVKVLETDAMDYESEGPNKDASMEDALKEINVLQRLQQSKATNVNLFYEAFQVHSQLWIVSEYCSGGSITTLRRATGNKLEERHIIPIARELAKGLKSVHDAGIIHRDIKCSNVMITENGRLQIIDFGVAGVLLSNLEDDKRKTIIGTPHWMAPEMQRNAAEIAHGTEVDCWAYGITLYECAMGAPPNARTMPGRELHMKMRREPAPRLPGDRFSTNLQDLVAFILEPDPKKRPTMDRICQQQYLVESESKYPTSSLAELVQKFYLWEHSGGSRASLFIEGGAAKPQLAPVGKDDDEEWNFSTTVNFEKRQQKEIIRLSMMDPNGHIDPQEFADMLAHSPPMDGDDEPFDQATLRSTTNDGAIGKGSVDNEARVARGARAMQGLFDESAEPYKYNYGANSDLPLRTEEGSESLHRKEVSVGSNSGTPQIDLSQVPKGRPNRATMNWKWDENLSGATATAPPATASVIVSPPQSQQIHHAAESMGNNRPMSETIDLDAMLGDDTAFTLSRGNQWASSTVTSSAPSIAGGDETDDDDGIIDLDIGDTMKPGYYAMGSNTIFHSKKESDSTMSLPLPSALPTLGGTTIYGSTGGRGQFLTGSTAFAASPYPPNLATIRSDRPQVDGYFPWPAPVNASALVNGATPETMTNALELSLQNWIAALEALGEKLDESEMEADGIDLGTEPDATVSTRGHVPKSSAHGSVSSLGGFSGPGEDVGEHIEDDLSVGTGDGETDQDTA